MQSELDLERVKVQRREQDTFQAQYELVCIREEMERSLEHIRTLENEREALRTSLKSEEASRLALEAGNAVLAAPKELEIRLSPRLDNHDTLPKAESMAHTASERRHESQIELEALQWALSQAEKQVDFMKMECQMGCCSCRLAERRGQSFVHDDTSDQDVFLIKAAFTSMITSPPSVKSELKAMNDQDAKEDGVADEAPVLPVPAQESPNNSVRLEEAAMLSETIRIDLQATAEHDMPPATPNAPPVRPQTTTRTIPLVDHSNKEYSVFSTPTGLTREQAIEQLRQRRGRARSAAGTPRKILDDGITPRRNVSAPQMQHQMTPGGSLRGRGR